ncbi:MAG: hypothetical protein LUH57_03685 [Ruminococcus sp.]|nr:hypothetical protein [Ruminococcus sp.]
MIMLVGMFVGVSSSATYQRETFRVQTGQVWNTRPALTRTQKYSYVRVKVNAVYPVLEVKDNYKYVQVRVINENGKAITSTCTLEEGTGGQRIDIKEGCLDASDIRFQYRGNDADLAADVDAISNAL